MNDSIHTFLAALHSAMADKEQFRLDITRNGDSLDIIALPLLGDDESKIPEQAKPIRSALSMPLAMRNMSLDEISGEFAHRMIGYGQARQQAGDAYQELLASLQDAAAAAKNTKAKTDKKGKGKTEAQATNEKPATEKSTEQAETPAEQEAVDTTKESTAGASAGLFDF